MGMLKLEYKPAGDEKWKAFGEDGNDFDTQEEAWAEAVEGAKLGAPYNGADYRIVDMGIEHADDCGYGLGGTCDCGMWVVVAGARVSWDGKAVLMEVGLAKQWYPVELTLEPVAQPEGAGLRHIDCRSGYPLELMAEREIDLGGCMSAGCGGYHTESYGDEGGACARCGEKGPVR